MHFAYQPRKSPNSLPFRAGSSRLPSLRRGRPRIFGLLLLGLVAIAYLVLGPGDPGPYHERVPSGSPPVVLLTAVDPSKWDESYLKTIRENREKYAARHGYQVMIVKMADYDTKEAPQSWGRIMAMRHALSKYPDCKFIWYLDQHAYIMNPAKSLREVVLDGAKLESMMIKDYPVVPPDSIIKTFTHLRAQDTDVILSQDKEGLLHKNIIIRNGEWAKFFLETWLNPIYRSYNFQKAEKHALEHIVQWHPTVLSKLALVPQRTFASYSQASLGDAYQDGDFVIMFAGCTQLGSESCELESSRYRQKLEDAYR